MKSIKLKDPQIRLILFKLFFSLLFTAFISYALYQFILFIQVTKEISVQFHATPSYEYNHSPEQNTAYYGCECADLHDKFICVNCVPAKKSHVVPDSKEVIYQREFHHLLIYTCPSSLVVSKEFSWCHTFVDKVLRQVLFAQEELLSSVMISSSVFSVVWCIYCILFRYWHQFIDRINQLNIIVVNKQN